MVRGSCLDGERSSARALNSDWRLGRSCVRSLAHTSLTGAWTGARLEPRWSLAAAAASLAHEPRCPAQCPAQPPTRPQPQLYHDSRSSYTHTHTHTPDHAIIMAQPPVPVPPVPQAGSGPPVSAFYPPYYHQGGGGVGGQLDPHLNLANDLRTVYQHNSYKDRVARATRNVLDQVNIIRQNPMLCDVVKTRSLPVLCCVS